MGEYKTFYMMRLRLFWPILIKDINKWVKGCAFCVSYNVWRTRRQELHSYWTFTIPFYIMHLGIWSPGAALNNNQAGCHQINVMSDLP